jgi:hypothetical protein
MCMRLKHLHKGAVQIVFLSRIHTKFIIKDTVLILCLSCRKKNINPSTFIFRITMEIIKLYYDPLNLNGNSDTTYHLYNYIAYTTTM